jgi:hypothetical protein
MEPGNPDKITIILNYAARTRRRHTLQCSIACLVILFAALMLNPPWMQHSAQAVTDLSPHEVPHDNSQVTLGDTEVFAGRAKLISTVPASIIALMYLRRQRYHDWPRLQGCSKHSGEWQPLIFADVRLWKLVCYPFMIFVMVAIFLYCTIVCLRSACPWFCLGAPLDIGQKSPKSLMAEQAPGRVFEPS